MVGTCEGGRHVIVWSKFRTRNRKAGSLGTWKGNKLAG